MVEREQVVVELIGRLQTKQRVGDHRERRDQDHHHDAHAEFVAEELCQQRCDRKDRDRLQDNGVGEDRPLHVLRQIHDDRNRHTDDDRDPEANEGDLDGRPHVSEDRADPGRRVPQRQESVGEHLMGVGKRIAALRSDVESHRAVQVPDADEEHEREQRREEVERTLPPRRARRRADVGSR